MERNDRTPSAEWAIGVQNKQLWVNRGTNAPPISGQANPYSLFGYDLNGRMTRRERKHDDGVIRRHGFYWDGDDRMRTVKEGADIRFTALYNGGGLRTSKWDHWTGQHDYSWGPGGVLHDSNGNTTYSAGFAHRQNGSDRFYHPDWLGSTRYLSDSTGNSFPNALRYDAYGQKVSQSGGWHPSDFLFAGGWGYQTEYGTDTEPGIGLQYLQQRYYEPATGRFLSADPLNYLDGPNLFSYTDSDPVNWVDPTGENRGSGGGVTPPGGGRYGSGRQPPGARFNIPRRSEPRGPSIRQPPGARFRGVDPEAIERDLIRRRMVGPRRLPTRPPALRLRTTPLEDWLMDQLFRHPENLRLVSDPHTIASMLRYGRHWRTGTLGKGRHAGQGMIIREIRPDGTLTGRVVQWHPGGGHHGPSPYWKLSSPLGGTIRIGPQFPPR